jgi:hypothetical protein
LSRRPRKNLSGGGAILPLKGLGRTRVTTLDQLNPAFFSDLVQRKYQPNITSPCLRRLGWEKEVLRAIILAEEIYKD